MSHVHNPKGITLSDCVSKAEELEETAETLKKAGLSARARQAAHQASTWRLLAEEFGTERKKSSDA